MERWVLGRYGSTKHQTNASKISTVLCTQPGMPTRLAHTSRDLRPKLALGICGDITAKSVVIIVVAAAMDG